MESAATPKVKYKYDPIVWWALGALVLVVAVLTTWGITSSVSEQDESDIRVCVMSRAMSDPSVSYETAKRDCKL